MYKIEIIKVTKDVPFKNKEYKVTGKDQVGEDTYEYVYFDDTKDVEETVYTQQVDDVDLVNVISAFNNKAKL